MLKYVGAILTLFSTGYMGFLWASTYEKRLRELRAMEAALQMLESEIVYGATPMMEAMDSVAERAEKNVSEIFAATSRELTKKEGATAGEAWERAIEKERSETCFLTQDIAILKRLGAVLGGSDREDQVKHFRLVKEQLTFAIAEAEAIASKSIKLYRSLGFLGGLFLILVIY